ncbi:alkylation response protein AidB-like acyl-CoA dehydrogenase [Wenyingzhuangia heitensis]|uniref:Alkylation response protein AidB-like acyl-CoA dehydrogenase n=1 Tax=Wenyingzhuangia heitensis TaxID=1487859 RepID=A0ABX0UAE9_9FLAO|nr:acyl-CoA dehydrogenase family protein [Wenyingzhuangia heitensis]NIJ44800.1 alkylation response protein AidB-like acyl-CoA dehydrogenase [Wenyingzhuangia heitensis]
MSIKDIQNISYNDFLKDFKETLKSVFYEKDDIQKFSQVRGFPSLVFRDIMAKKPLSVAIPTEFGGRGVKVKECLGVLEAASYESLPLSLTFGINIALFLEPVAKYAKPEVKAPIFKRFLEDRNMGGLMITEPSFGSDALSMETSNTFKDGKYHIEGYKHWQGLTGLADYWLITSRKKAESGQLGRDIDFFIADNQDPEQRVIVEEYYNNAGLYAIPYGNNKLDLKVPENQKLEGGSTGIKLMLDLLHRSRMQFPGMAMGFIKRMMDEAIDHCNNRIVGGKNLLALDKVREQISNIQAAFTVCSAMCARSSENSGIDNELAMSQVEANSMKSVITDMMQFSAQTLVQLSGSSGYKEENIGARGIMDSRAFMIFEGSNEMLYTQISEAVMKLMRRKKVTNLFDFLSSYDLTIKSSEFFKELLNFNLNMELPQRKMVDLGKIIGRVVSANFVVDLGIKGFRSDLVSECITSLKHEVTACVSSLTFQESTALITDYKEDSTWLNLV